jgi:hypothetical protein
MLEWQSFAVVGLCLVAIVGMILGLWIIVWNTFLQHFRIFRDLFGEKKEQRPLNKRRVPALGKTK